MVSYRGIKMMWSVTLVSENKLSNKNKNLIVELIDNESHKATRKYKFILHNILEGNNFSEAIIEGGECAVKNIKDVLKNTLNHMLVNGNIQYFPIFM